VLDGKREATIAYLPQASLAAEKWLKETQRAFRTRRDRNDRYETMQLAEMEGVLRRAALVYIPAGMRSC